MDENMKIEETTNEVTTVENTNCEAETSGGSSTIAKIVIVGVVGAVAGAAGAGTWLLLIIDKPAICCAVKPAFARVRISSGLNIVFS